MRAIRGDPDGRTTLSADENDTNGKTWDTSVALLLRVRGGDRDALAQLLDRHRPALARWARGRLPRWARGAVDTEDLVQDVLVKSMHALGEFEARGDGALQAYLRQAVLHRIRDEIRKAKRRGEPVTLDSREPHGDPSPHEEAEARELLDAYEAALGRLREEDRAAIFARVELRLPFREVARVLEKPTEEAAQMAVHRALVRLAREMGRAD